MLTYIRLFGFIALIAPFAALGESGDSTSGDSYWVLGSYTDQARAVSERERLSNTLGEAIEISRHESDGGTLFRVVVADDDGVGERLSAHGIDTWRMSIAASSFEGVADAVDYFLVIDRYRGEEQAASNRNELEEKMSGLKVVTDGSDDPWFMIARGPFETKVPRERARALATGVRAPFWFASSASERDAARQRALASTIEVAPIEEPSPMEAPTRVAQ